MSTLSQLQAQQVTAGTAYITALQQLETAYANLSALDNAIGNVSRSPVRTFGFNLDQLRATLAAHPACFAASDGSPWYKAQLSPTDQARATAATIVNNFTPGS